MFSLFSPQKPTTEKPPLQLFDSLTNKKRLFTPLKNKSVTMYSCGPTVYDHIHIGNLRAYLLPDIAKRILSYNGFTVEHTINFTDFGHLTDDADAGEDKMMKALTRHHKPATLGAMREVAQLYIDSFKRDNLAFHNLPPTHYTPASSFVREQITLIKTLFEKGYAYETSDGIYFDISKFPTYGRIGNIDVKKLRDGARVAVNTEKRHPADFALWKKSLLGWESAWGKGFPGWHIECTAMCFATLGKQIDIHTGGEDLKYTHHNGEIAQAEAITGKPYVGYWLHNAHLAVDGTKVSKSLSNGIRLSSLADQGFPPIVYRYWLLTAHYRSPVNFTFDALRGAKQALFRLKRFLYEDCKNVNGGTVNEAYRQMFHAAINNDLDTPRALAILWEMVKDNSLSAADKVATIKHFDGVLDIGLSDTLTVERELAITDKADISPAVLELLAAREAARTARNWEESDRVRELINLHGYTVIDTPDGQQIEKVE